MWEKPLHRGCNSKALSGEARRLLIAQSSPTLQTMEDELVGVAVLYQLEDKL